MAVLKNIHVTIYKYNKEGVAEPILNSVLVNTYLFPHSYVAGLMALTTGHIVEEDDHGLLNNLQAHGKTAFKFGPDWEFYVDAQVIYPK